MYMTHPIAGQICILRRGQKLVEQMLTELGLTNSPEMPTRATCGAWLALRLEIIALQDLKRRMQARSQADGGAEGRGKRTHKGKVMLCAALRL
jgi:hypothetical protein